MKIWLSKNLLAKLEFGIVVVLLFFSEGLVFSDFVRAITSYAIYGFLLLVISIRWKRFAYAFIKDPLLAFFILLAAFSFFWSANPSATLIELKLSIYSALLGVYLAMQYKPREQIRLLSWTYGMSIVLCLAMAILFPSIGTKVFEGKVSMIGIYTHKQSLGSHMSLAASVFLISVFDRRFNRWIALAGLMAAFILILGSLSKTALISFLLLLSLMPLYKIAKQGNLKRVISLIFETRATEYFWMILFLGCFLVFNFIEGAIVFGQNIFWIVYISIAVSSALKFSRMKRNYYSSQTVAEPEMAS